jgi:hypothetical protein
MNLRHIGIVTINIKHSLQFWKKYFGFKIVKDLYERGDAIDSLLGYKNCKIRTIKLNNKKGLILELIEIKKPKLRKRRNLTINNGITHFAMTTENLDNFYKKNKEKITFNCSPQISKNGDVKVLYLKTPENCYLELVEKL